MLCTYLLQECFGKLCFVPENALYMFTPNVFCHVCCVHQKLYTCIFTKCVYGNAGVDTIVLDNGVNGKTGLGDGIVGNVIRILVHIQCLI